MSSMLTNPLWELQFFCMFWGFFGEWRLTHCNFSVQHIDCIAQTKTQHLGNTFIFHLLGFSSNKPDWYSSIPLPGCFWAGGEEGEDRKRCYIKVRPPFRFPLLPQLDFWLFLWALYTAHHLHLSSTYWAQNLLLNSLLTMAMSHKLLSVVCGSSSELIFIHRQG